MIQKVRCLNAAMVGEAYNATPCLNLLMLVSTKQISGVNLVLHILQFIY